MKGDIEIKDNHLKEKGEQIKNLSEKLNKIEDDQVVNKSLTSFLNTSQDNEDKYFKDEVNRILKAPDGEKNIISFVYVLYNKVKNYQVELEQGKLF
jgi:hypothetical protein